MHHFVVVGIQISFQLWLSKRALTNTKLFSQSEGTTGSSFSSTTSRAIDVVLKVPWDNSAGAALVEWTFKWRFCWRKIRVSMLYSDKPTRHVDTMRPAAENTLSQLPEHPETCECAVNVESERTAFEVQPSVVMATTPAAFSKAFTSPKPSVCLHFTKAAICD